MYRIVTLGDSATYGALVPYNETYSYALQEILRDDYGYSQVEVVNGGVTGYASWNMLVDLAFRIPVLQPDLVIVYQGWNDLEARERSPDCYSDPSPFLGLDPRRELRVQPTELSPSALYRFLAINFGWMPNPGAESIPLVNSEIGCSAQDLSEIAENIAANPPIYFERNTREMIGIARTLGFRIMLMTWAYDVNSDQMRPYRVPAIAEHNAITARIAEENDVLFLDYAAVAPSDESDWRDTAHMSAQGNRSFAHTIARYLVDQQVIPAPPG
ncbi:MAG: SGNH/GDSL hydrolase family protein [Anaerolineae bacterium]